MKDRFKVGIMGGTFNPVHNGHLMLANNAYETLKLDKVLFIPSGNSYMKKNVLSAKERSEMVQLAIANFPHFEMSTLEMERKGATYTYETLEVLKKDNPDTDYYFIIGADSLFNIEKWKNPKRIYELCTLVCAVRDDYDLQQLHEKGEVMSKAGAHIEYLNISKIEISSTDIRERVKKGHSIIKFVPTNVLKYIEQEKLYYEKD